MRLPQSIEQLPSRANTRIGEGQGITKIEAGIIAIGAVVLVLWTTLYPFNFALDQNLFGWDADHTFDTRLIKSDSLTDLPRNVLLFLPIGFGIGAWAYACRFGVARALIVVLVTGIGLSVAVELIQLSLPSRASEVSDIVANAAGAALGYLCFRLMRHRFYHCVAAWHTTLKRHLSYRTLFVALAAYIFLLAFTAYQLQGRTQLVGWDLDLPLIIGNERTGDRAWHGSVQELHILNKAILKEEIDRVFRGQNLSDLPRDFVVTSYCLICEKGRIDRTGTLPNLVVKGSNPVDSALSNPGTTNAIRWFETDGSAAALTKSLLHTSEFSVILSLITVDAVQTGPARILSISGDPFVRNFTVAQENVDLVIRLRTPLSGENGNKPEIRIPHVFDKPGERHLAITYRSSRLTVYMDDVQHVYTVELAPQIATLRYLMPNEPWYVPGHPVNLALYKAIYYTLVGLPVAILLALMLYVRKQ